MSKSSRVLFHSFGFVAALALASLGACSGGGGTGQAQPQPEAPGAFAGTWDLTAVITSSSSPNVQVGQQSTDTIVITVAGTTATLIESGGNLVGTIQGRRLQLARSDISISLTIGSDDRLTGTATQTGVENGNTETINFNVSAVRSQGGGGGGNALALATGTWTFVVDINGSPLFFDDGALTQNGAAVEFAWSDQSATPPITSIWTGDLAGAQWSPVTTGTLPFTVTGTFANDGRSFTGTFTSSLLGNGAITGAIEP